MAKVYDSLLREREEHRSSDKVVVASYDEKQSQSHHRNIPGRILSRPSPSANLPEFAWQLLIDARPRHNHGHRNEDLLPPYELPDTSFEIPAEEGFQGTYCALPRVSAQLPRISRTPQLGLNVYKIVTQSPNQNNFLHSSTSNGNEVRHRPLSLIGRERGSTAAVTPASIGPGRQLPKRSKRLRHEQYTVGWMCALSTEMAAAKAMLDEFHEPLPNPHGDSNAYQLGSIGGHNVVITCIRLGVYGTTSATATATSMLTTYPNCNLTPLLVGIGGGVPSLKVHDIRLGDVVISTPSPDHPAVVQHDYGKAEKNGHFQIKGFLNKPAPALLNALPHFQSDPISTMERISKHISVALRTYLNGDNRYCNPGPEKDILYGHTCEHAMETTVCNACSSKPITREDRLESGPKLHYGSIASGNSVIKDAATRDRISEQLGVLCFEMEAAGVMDYLPCLVIRGICDYCDSHKTKIWQEYAALTAAAVAKAFLLCVPRPAQFTLYAAEMEEQEQKRIALMDSLDFQESNTRRSTVRRAHVATCKWVLDHPVLQRWLQSEAQDQQRLLWIKGKPGAGKSTIMKWLLEHTESTYRYNESVIIISFFFNARGAELGRSTEGMYRSILVQILRQYSGLPDPLGTTYESIKFGRSPQWTVEMLEELLGDVVASMDSVQIIFYIDALDECSEDQARLMVNFFDRLLDEDYEKRLYICFSSRHYPHISTRHESELVLDTQEGHSQDILKYLESELQLDNGNAARTIWNKVHSKSKGIFLWIILVVRILRAAFDRGEKHKLSKILDEIPSQVDDLFKDILTRDNRNVPELVACLRWVLYAKRPLTIHELYYAMISIDPSFEPQSYSRFMIMRGSIDLWTYIQNCSKGMLDTTISTTTTVQFIHETVREFLLQPFMFEKLFPGVGDMSQSSSQNLLAQHCYRFSMEHGGIQLKNGTRFHSKYSDIDPFLRYALIGSLYHADQAELYGVSQTNFLANFDYEKWFLIYRMLENWEPFSMHVQPMSLDDQEPVDGPRYREPAFLGLLLIRLNMDHLSRCWMQSLKTRPDWDRIAPSLMLECTSNNNYRIFADIVWTWQDINSRLRWPRSQIDTVADFISQNSAGTRYCEQHLVNLMAKVMCVKPNNDDLLNLALCVAIPCLSKAVIELLLKNGATVTTDEEPNFALRLLLNLEIWDDDSQIRSSKKVIRSQLGYEVAFQDSGIIFYGAWQETLTSCYDLLLAHGANPRILSDYDEAFLLGNGKGACNVGAMVKAAATPNSRDADGNTPAHHMIKRHLGKGLPLLITAGADLDAQNVDGQTPLHLAASQRYLIVRMLLDVGVDINIVDLRGNTPLHLASSWESIGLLLKAGANIEARNCRGDTALHTAARDGRYNSMEQLLYGRCMLDPQNEPHGFTPLHVAILKGSPHGVSILLNYGASVDIKAHDGRNACHMALGIDVNEDSQTLLGVCLALAQSGSRKLPERIVRGCRLSADHVMRVLRASSVAGFSIPK